MKRNKYVFISVLLHGMLFVGLGVASGGEGSQKANSEHTEGNGGMGDQGKIITVELKADVEPSDVLAPEAPKAIKVKDECKRSFGGIGIIFSSEDYRNGYIAEVAPGYPAAVAGLQVGDHIKNIDGTDIKGEIGTPVTLQVERAGQLYLITLTRAKICVGDR